jgi:hypothetical protein
MYKNLNELTPCVKHEVGDLSSFVDTNDKYMGF